MPRPERRRGLGHPAGAIDDLADGRGRKRWHRRREPGASKPPDLRGAADPCSFEGFHDLPPGGQPARALEPVQSLHERFAVSRVHLVERAWNLGEVVADADRVPIEALVVLGAQEHVERRVFFVVVHARPGPLHGKACLDSQEDRIHIGRAALGVGPTRRVARVAKLRRLERPLGQAVDEALPLRTRPGAERSSVFVEGLAVDTCLEGCDSRRQQAYDLGCVEGEAQRAQLALAEVAREGCPEARAIVFALEPSVEEGVATLEREPLRGGVDQEAERVRLPGCARAKRIAGPQREAPGREERGPDGRCLTERPGSDQPRGAGTLELTLEQRQTLSEDLGRAAAHTGLNPAVEPLGRHAVDLVRELRCVAHVDELGEGGVAVARQELELLVAQVVVVAAERTRLERRPELPKAWAKRPARLAALGEVDELAGRRRAATRAGDDLRRLVRFDTERGGPTHERRQLVFDVVAPIFVGAGLPEARTALDGDRGRHLEGELHQRVVDGLAVFVGHAARDHPGLDRLSRADGPLWNDRERVLAVARRHPAQVRAGVGVDDFPLTHDEMELRGIRAAHPAQRSSIDGELGEPAFVGDDRRPRLRAQAIDVEQLHGVAREPGESRVVQDLEVEANEAHGTLGGSKGWTGPRRAEPKSAGAERSEIVQARRHPSAGARARSGIRGR